MIIVVTTFTLPEPLTREQARDIFLSTAPKYRGVQGLLRKHYVLSEDGGTAGGVYLWAAVAVNARSDRDGRSISSHFAAKAHASD